VQAQPQPEPQPQPEIWPSLVWTPVNIYWADVTRQSESCAPPNPHCLPGILPSSPSPDLDTVLPSLYLHTISILSPYYLHRSIEVQAQPQLLNLNLNHWSRDLDLLVLTGLYTLLVLYPSYLE
jgi:hypothetical protein